MQCELCGSNETTDRWANGIVTHFCDGCYEKHWKHTFNGQTYELSQAIKKLKSEIFKIPRRAKP